MGIKYKVGLDATTDTPIDELTMGESANFPVDRVLMGLNLADSAYGATDADTWYPCIIQPHSAYTSTHIEICRHYGDTYPTGALGGLWLSCIMHGSSWGGNTMKITTFQAHETYRRMCLGWGWMAHGQYFGVMLRGGYNYRATINKPVHAKASIDLHNWTETNSGHGWQVITSSTTVYDHSDSQYDKTVAPVTSATASNVTNQTGYWNGTSITASISEDRRINTIGS